MTIIVFLIDTSASMNQRACLGGRPTLLDVAKGAVETFVKVRQRSPESRVDRYMLMTFEDPPNNIKAGWKENISIFMNELKNLTCVGLTTLGAALKHAFDVLNINRMQTGIDTYGQGRCPFFLEPSVIVVITDGGKLSTMTGVQEDFNLPMHSPIPGSELTREPFRWDQRLFSLVLRLSGTPAMDRDTGLVPSDTSPIDAMCEVTGGRSYCITSQRMLLQCVDSLVLKVQSGVVINLEKIGPDPPPLNNVGADGIKVDGTADGEDGDKDVNDVDGNRSNSASTAWHNCRRLIYVPRAGNQKGYAVGFWPIPESFWPDANATSLPPRSAHPNMKFTCTSQEPMVIDNLPFDKYELEPSPLTQYILARKQPTVCWQVFVPNSYKNSDVGHPFGYLKASTNLSCVNLFVMPYNYPALLPLLDELFKVHRSKPTPEWRAQFQNYLRTMPAYYALPLRRALTRMGSPGNLPQTLVPESLDSSLNYGVLSYLKRVKSQAKTEHDKLCNEVSNKTSKVNLTGNEGVRLIPRSPLKKDLVSHPLLQDKFNNLREQLSDFGGFQAGLDRGTTIHGVHNYRNAFDTPRRALLDQVVRMRANFLQTNLDHTKVVDEDWKHSMPVCQMGNYQEHLKRMQPQLREIESAPVRQHMFGNPFKIEKSMMVDEADMDMVAGGSGGSGSSPRSASKRGQPGRGGSASSLDGRGPPNKRKPGPIPRDLHVRRPTSPRPGTPILTPTLSPPPSPGTGTGTGTTPPTSPLPLGISPLPLPLPLPPFGPTPPGTPASSPPAQNSLLIISQPGSPGSPGGPGAPVQPSTPLGILPTLGGPVAGAAAVAAPTTPISVTAATADGGAIPPEVTPMDVDDVKGGEVADILHTNGPVSNGQSTFVKEEISNLPNLPQLGENATSAELASATTGVATSAEAVAVAVAQPNLTRQNSLVMKRELAKIKRHNLNVRAAAYKEVRRPGKNFSVLLEKLQGLQGGPEVKAVILQQVIEESLRFKRRQLATLVQQVLNSVEASAATSATAGLVNNHNSAS